MATCIRILQTSKHDVTKKDFHVLRVQIKRLRAVLALLKCCNPSRKGTRKFKSLLQIYRQAGKVRELQILLEFIGPQSAKGQLTTYAARLQFQLQDELQCYFALTRKKNIKRISKKAAQYLPQFKKVKRKRGTAYLEEKRMKVVDLLMAPELQSSELHDLRKRIKELYFLQKLLLGKQETLQTANAFQELLGDWHDGEVILKDLVCAEEEAPLPPDELEVLHTLLTETTAKNAVRLESIHHDRMAYLASQEKLQTA